MQSIARRLSFLPVVKPFLTAIAEIVARQNGETFTIHKVQL
jgi:hypothetical protein